MPSNTLYPDALSVTTLPEFSAEIWNLIIGQNDILRFLDKFGVVERKTGGLHIVERVMYAENSTFGTISAYEAIPLTPQEPFHAAHYSWKIIAGAYSLANLVVFQNSGSAHQISNIVTDLLMNAAESGKLELIRQFWADGTGNGGKDFGGVLHIIAKNSWGTVGNINSTTDTWWRNQFQASIGSAAANLSDKMATLRYSTTRNGRKPLLYIGEQNFVEAYERACLQLKRNVFENKRVADLGLPNLEYAGGAVVLDPNVTSGKFYVITPESFKLTLGTDQKFKKSPMVAPVDQDVKSQLFVLYGNVTCSDRSNQGVGYGITYP